MNHSEQLAAKIRDALGDYNDREKPLAWLIRDLVAKLDAAAAEAIGDIHTADELRTQLAEAKRRIADLEQQPRAVPEFTGEMAAAGMKAWDDQHRTGVRSWPAMLEAVFRAMLQAAPPPPAQAEQQYFYRVNECKAIDSKSDLCICWHDQGTGPFPDAKPDDETPSNWRAKPVAVSDAPCDKCGYNGPGYYQPDTHPCVAQAAGGVVLDDAVSRLQEAANRNSGDQYVMVSQADLHALFAQQQPEVGRG